MRVDKLLHPAEGQEGLCATFAHCDLDGEASFEACPDASDDAARLPSPGLRLRHDGV